MYPLKTPDLKPIEHLSDEFGRRVSEDKNLLTTQRGYQIRIVHSWTKISVTYFRSFVLTHTINAYIVFVRKKMLRLYRVESAVIFNAS